MHLRPHIFAQQRQSTVLAAQVIQSIKLLQYGQDELLAFLKEQADRNPLIELADFAGMGDRAAGEAPMEEGERVRDAAGPSANGVPGRAAPRAEGRDFPAFGGAGRGTGRAIGEDVRSLEDYVASSVSLAEHLRGQVALTFHEPAERIVAAEIVASLDLDGYLRRDLEDIADALGTDLPCVEACLRKVQGFDPTGVAARSLPECLRLQLEERGRLTPAMAVLLDHLPMLARYEVPELARLCDIEAEAVLKMAREIRNLDPRPGRRFDTGPTLPALPDVLVEVRPDGSCAVELNADLLPRVLVNQRYYAEVAVGAIGGQDRVFVTDCLRDANWLARNMEQRAQTILRVATEIVAQQRDFLLRGVQHLRPLSLKDVARALGVHESTVCRATANKYMMTCRGLFEMKFFFTHAITATDGGGSFSAETIRHRIRQMIEAESAAAVLSDDEIMGALRGEGVEIARRTVAKYREALNIPSSARRRRQRAAAQIETHAAA
jgi:RNA polymerase sigma-54 factor